MTWSPLSWVRKSVRRRWASTPVSRPSDLPVLVFQVAQPGTQIGRKGRQFGRVLQASGLSSPSPRMMARTPLTQPRQLNWATTTVMMAITSPNTAISPTR
jgi:hypothetical protein